MLCKIGHLSATDLADYLVQNKICHLEQLIILQKMWLKKQIV